MNRENLKQCYDIAVERATKRCQVSGQNLAWAWEEEYAIAILELAQERLREFANFPSVAGVEFDDGVLEGIHIACMQIARLQKENE